MTLVKLRQLVYTYVERKLQCQKSLQSVKNQSNRIECISPQLVLTISKGGNMLTLITENCEEIKLPNPFFFGFADDDESLLIGVRVEETPFLDTLGGWKAEYMAMGVDRVIKTPDITSVVYGRTYSVPYKGEELNEVQGGHFQNGCLYLAFGNKNSLKRLVKGEEAFYEGTESRNGFLRAIDNISDNNSLNKKPKTTNALTALVKVLATHYKKVDEPRGGWESRGGCPYDEIIKDL